MSWRLVALPWLLTAVFSLFSRDWWAVAEALCVVWVCTAAAAEIQTTRAAREELRAAVERLSKVQLLVLPTPLHARASEEERP